VLNRGVILVVIPIVSLRGSLKRVDRLKDLKSFVVCITIGITSSIQTSVPNSFFDRKEIEKRIRQVEV